MDVRVGLVLVKKNVEKSIQDQAVVYGIRMILPTRKKKHEIILIPSVVASQRLEKKMSRITNALGNQFFVIV